MVRDKKQVHEAAAKRLLTNTQPTDLHRELVRLFGDPAKVRIVTTNFDNHFTDAATEVFPGKDVPEFHAPALPLGDDFEGIVYSRRDISAGYPARRQPSSAIDRLCPCVPS